MNYEHNSKKNNEEKKKIPPVANNLLEEASSPEESVAKPVYFKPGVPYRFSHKFKKLKEKDTRGNQKIQVEQSSKTLFNKEKRKPRSTAEVVVDDLNLETLYNKLPLISKKIKKTDTDFSPDNTAEKSAEEINNEVKPKKELAQNVEPANIPSEKINLATNNLANKIATRTATTSYQMETDSFEEENNNSLPKNWYLEAFTWFFLILLAFAVGFYFRDKWSYLFSGLASLAGISGFSLWLFRNRFGIGLLVISRSYSLTKFYWTVGAIMVSIISSIILILTVYNQLHRGTEANTERITKVTDLEEMEQSMRAKSPELKDISDLSPEEEMILWYKKEYGDDYAQYLSKDLNDWKKEYGEEAFRKRWGYRLYAYEKGMVPEESKKKKPTATLEEHNSGP